MISRSLAITILVSFMTLPLACKKDEPATQVTTETSERPSTAPSPSAQRTTSTFKVHLRVTGAVHLVGDAASQRLLVVPNLTAHNHKPLLIALPTAVVSGLNKQREQLHVNQLPGQGAMYKFTEMPAGFEIDLPRSGWSNATPTLTFTEAGDATNADCPGSTGTPPESLHWLPRLSTVSQAGAPYALKQALVKADPSPDDVISRLPIIDGLLQAQLTGQRRLFAFDVTGKPNPVKQTVAEYLRYSFDIELSTSNPVFTLRGRKFRTTGSNPGDIIDFGQFRPTGSEIEIILANLPEDDFFKPRATGTIPHFEHYYEIVDGAHDKARPRQIGVCPEARSGGTIECGPTRVP